MHLTLHTLESPVSLHRGPPRTLFLLSSPHTIARELPARGARAELVSDSECARIALWIALWLSLLRSGMSGEGLASASCDGLSTTRNLEMVRNRFPGCCPYFITHNVLGGRLDRHSSCTADPLSTHACEHGRHERPSGSAAKNFEVQIAAEECSPDQIRRTVAGKQKVTPDPHEK